ncbi:diguanylate cyclase [Pseudoduganella sp. GCM10020061]|uniref:diguanylate cyclase n=1 Tax=Pseudoduganella sp. GCM10020061 TaxID=3317345 RepID=UPI00363A77C6
MSTKVERPRGKITPQDRIRRMLGYWASNAVLYIICIGLVLDEIVSGTLALAPGIGVIAFAVAHLAIFYVLIRRSPYSGIPHWKLAWAQGFLAVSFLLILYALLPSVHANLLIGLPVIVVFLAFPLRPRQTIALSAFAIIGLVATAATIHLLDPAAFPLRSEIVNVIIASAAVIAVTLITRDLHALRQRLRGQADNLISALARIETLATTDELTALSNRRHMHELLDQEERRSSGDHRPTSIALIDIDHFKQINDRFGHAGGDAALRALSREVRRFLREDDTLARWGGEEFLMLMPDTMLADAMKVVERMLDGVRKLVLDDAGYPFKLTFSAGVVECRPDERFAEAIRRSDLAMYEAKARGRDIVVAG